MRCVVLFFVALLAGCDSSHEASAAGEVKSAFPANAGLAHAMAGNDELTAAQAAIDAGHPWRATQTLAPLLRDASKRSPAVLVVAARAAAGWGGWAEIDKLLAGQVWVDTMFDGEARELLARAALERGIDTLAATNAAAAVRDAKSADARAVRLVWLARALERGNLLDSAAATYARAGETSGALRPVRDWLALRAAGAERDSISRVRLYDKMSLAVARPRIAWTEAQARERFLDLAGAAQRYAALGAVVPSLRLKLSLPSDSATRDALRAELLTYIRGRNPALDVRSAIEVLDKAFPRLTQSEELIVARGAAVAGPPARAVTGYTRAAAALTPADRLSFAQSLSRVGRSRDAVAQLDSVSGPAAGQAAYQRARLTLTSAGDATRTALRGIVAKFPTDTVAAGSALFLLADLLTDDGNDAQARSLYQQLYHDYPSSSRAAEARFNAAMISVASGDAATAARELDSLVLAYPRADDAMAARYWAGREWSAAGDSALGAARLRDVVRLQPVSYYGFAANRQLGASSWASPAPAAAVPHVAAVDNAIARAVILERLGMDGEARLEYEALEDAASKAPPDRAAAIATAFGEHGQVTRALHIAQRLVDAGRRDQATYRILFPVPDPEELARDAKARALEPALVAGIIRQESSFNARAVSVAGARGLMQLLPSVGQEVSRSTSFGLWYPALLLDPDANLQLGTMHLATYVKQYGALPRVLAAYNAGGSRVTRWATRRGANDPELFTERIPFAETRDYVRLVLRNAQVYRVLYEW
jgi:soluble lytic murein transglycosylase